MSAIDNRLSMDFEDKLEEILSILRRHELDIRPALTWEIETDEDEADAVKALKMTLCEDVHQFWPLDAILELIDLHFDERDANEDIESWYMIRKIEPRTDDQGALKNDLQCPSRFKVRWPITASDSHCRCSEWKKLSLTQRGYFHDTTTFC